MPSLAVLRYEPRHDQDGATVRIATVHLADAAAGKVARASVDLAREAFEDALKVAPELPTETGATPAAHRRRESQPLMSRASVPGDGANANAGANTRARADPVLARLLASWPTLPAPIRAFVAALLDAATTR